MSDNSQLYDRPTVRDDHVARHIVDFFDNIDCAQSHVFSGEPSIAKLVADNAVAFLKSRVGTEHLLAVSVTASPVGRLEAFVHYSDDLGTIRTTYKARTPIND